MADQNIDETVSSNVTLTMIGSHQNIYVVCDLISQYVLQRSSQLAVAIIEPTNAAVARYIPKRLYTEVKHNLNVKTFS